MIQSIFTGGDGSGYALKENIQAICTPLPIQSIFLGGSGNGYSFKENIQAVCTPLAIESIFFGGSGTGAAMKEGGCNTFDPPPNILSAQVLSDNLQVELTFSELVYGSATTTSTVVLLILISLFKEELPTYHRQLQVVYLYLEHRCFWGFQ